MSSKQHQSGFALLFFMLILLGLGGVALTGVGQSLIKKVEAKKIGDTRQVLEDAKQALLMYAYNYSRVNDDGPGRLPCPYDNETGYSAALSDAICDAVGRLPVDSLGLQFAKAAKLNDEDLWYAVSDAFYNFNPGGGTIVNSDTVGTITLFDQTGNLIYDGSTAGIAAVIIAPGPAISRDENNDGVYEYLQKRTTTAEKINPKNYLDTFNGFDNSVFLNGGNAVSDGFILGPVRDANTNSYVINDQVVIITADEVIAMAEKAMLEIYSEAIADYQTNTGNVYPWLYDYATSDLSVFTSVLTNMGRIPSIFGQYFVETDSEPYDSELRVTLSKSFDVSGTSHTLVFDQQTAGAISNLRFTDTGADNDDIGQINGDALVENNEVSMYFYDADASIPFNWILCGGGANELSDCNRNNVGANIPVLPVNLTDSKILKVTISIDYSVAIAFDLNYANPVSTVYTAADNTPKNAEIINEFNVADVLSTPAVLSYEVADYTATSNYISIITEQQPLLDNTNLGAHVSNLSTVGTISLGMRYYPELPNWAASTQNNWNNSIMMAISPAYQPGGGLDCVATSDCLTISDLGGTNDDVVSLLVIAGSSDIVDEGVDDFSNDLVDIFATENQDMDLQFESRSEDDKLLVLQRQP